MIYCMQSRMVNVLSVASVPLSGDLTGIMTIR